MKRRPAAAAPRLAKRPAVAAVIEAEAEAEPEPPPKSAEHEVIARALLASSEYPVHVLEMLSISLARSLGTPKAERHPFQVTVVGMVDEVLTQRETHLQAALTQAEAKVSDAIEQRTQREKAHEAATQDLTAKEEALSAAQVAVESTGPPLLEATKALSSVTSEWGTHEASIQTAQRELARLASTLSASHLPLKEGKVEEGQQKAAVDAVLQVGKQFDFEAPLLAALPSASAHPPDSRGSFDAMVMNHLEAEFGRCSAEIQGRLEAAEAAKKELDAKVADATEQEAKAKATAEANEAARQAAEDALKEAKIAKAAASEALERWTPEFEAASDDVSKAKFNLDAFRKGPLTYYKELLEL